MNSICSNSAIKTHIKLRLYSNVTLPTVAYAYQTCKGMAKTDRRLTSFHQRCLRKILMIKCRNQLKNEEILRRTKSQTLQEIPASRNIDSAEPRWHGQEISVKEAASRPLGGEHSKPIWKPPTTPDTDVNEWQPTESWENWPPYVPDGTNWTKVYIKASTYCTVLLRF